MNAHVFGWSIFAALGIYGWFALGYKLDTLLYHRGMLGEGSFFLGWFIVSLIALALFLVTR